MSLLSKVGGGGLAAVFVALLAGGAAGQAGPEVPDINKISILIRTTLIAVDHANRTGNYTVLRDLGSPGFRKANTAARLAEIFGNLRKKDLDLGPIVLFKPKLTRQPSIDQLGMLRITGFIPTKPLSVAFDLAYERIGGRWQLFGISINAATPK